RSNAVGLVTRRVDGGLIVHTDPIARAPITALAANGYPDAEVGLPAATGRQRQPEAGVPPAATEGLGANPVGAIAERLQYLAGTGERHLATIAAGPALATHRHGKAGPLAQCQRRRTGEAAVTATAAHRLRKQRVRTLPGAHHLVIDRLLGASLHTAGIGQQHLTTVAGGTAPTADGHRGTRRRHVFHRDRQRGRHRRAAVAPTATHRLRQYAIAQIAFGDDGAMVFQRHIATVTAATARAAHGGGGRQH